MSSDEQCAICGQYWGEDNIQQHLRKEHTEKEVQNNLSRGMAGTVFHQDSIQRCELCGEVEDPVSLEEHVLDQHLSEMEKVQYEYGKLFIEELPELPNSLEDCPLCGLQIADENPTRIDVVNHLIEVHSAEEYDQVAEEFGEKAAARVVTVWAEEDDDEGSNDINGFDASNEDATTETPSTTSDEEPPNKPTNVDSQNDSNDPASSEQGESGSTGSAVSRSEFDTSRGSGKYSAFGVGGAGNWILDSFLMRRDTLEEDDSDLASAWRGGLENYHMINTNNAEIMDTYYRQVDRNLDHSDVLAQCTIGRGAKGAGRDPAEGMRQMNLEIAEGRSLFNNWPLNPEDVSRAQAIMFIHSVVKGTGSGATPVLAEHLRDEVATSADDSPMVGITVLPPEKATKYNPEETVNAGFGFGLMSSAVDVIIPFDNSRLEKVEEDISPEIDYLDDLNPSYSKPNRPLTQFVEAFMMTSNPETGSDDSDHGLDTRGQRDDGFDVPDSYLPIANRYPRDRDHEHHPAVVAAPLMAVSDAKETVTRGTLDILINNAFNHGLLVDCDPETAWGGAFIFYGPRDIMDDVSSLIQDFAVHEAVSDALGTTELRVHPHQAIVPEVDRLHMWGILWNPKMDALEEMFEKTKDMKERNNDIGELIETNWDRINPVYSFLGRENRE